MEDTPSEDPVFASGDAILVVGSAYDGLVGTVLRRNGDRYLVALEDGAEVVLTAEHLTLRQ